MLTAQTHTLCLCLAEQVIVAAAVALCGCLLVASNPYGPTYNDGYGEQSYHQPSYKQEPSYHKPAPSYYKAEPTYEYQAPAYSPPAYHAPAYPKYQAPSSAHHTQYDNYYPKQTYNKPMYAAPKPYAPPTYSAPAYQAAPAYHQAPAKPSYPQTYPQPMSYNGGHAEEYKAKA